MKEKFKYMTKTAHKSLFVAIFAAMIMMFALIGGSVQAAAVAGPSAASATPTVEPSTVYQGAKPELTIALPSATYASASTITISDDFGGSYAQKAITTKGVTFANNVISIAKGSVVAKDQSVQLYVTVPESYTGNGTITLTMNDGFVGADNTTTTNLNVLPVTLSASATGTASLNDAAAPNITVQAMSSSATATSSLLTNYTWNVTSSNTGVATASINAATENTSASVTLSLVAAGTTNITSQLLSPAGAVVAEATTAFTVNDNIELTSFDVSPKTVTLDYGKTQQITPSFLPVTATNKALTYKSDSSSVATVSSTGLITAVGAGKTNITVTAAGIANSSTNTNNTKTVSVTVKPLAATGVSFAADTATVNITPAGTAPSASYTPVATVAPEGASQGVTYSLVTGTKNTAVTNGKYDVYAKEGTANTTKLATVSLNANNEVIIKAAAATTKDADIIAAVKAADIKVKAIVKSDAKLVAYQTIEAGTATLKTLTIRNGETNLGKSASYAWSEAGVALNVIGDAYAGQTPDLSTTTWKVTQVNNQPTKIATIAANGATNTLVFKEAGTVRVTATAYGISEYVDITMTAPALTGFTLDPASTTLYLVGGTGYPSSYLLSASSTATQSASIIGTPTGSNAADATYTFSSQNPSIASVNTSGTITAVKAGTTNIFVNAVRKSDNAALEMQTLVVTVVDKPVYPSAMTVEPTVLDLKIGGNSADETATLTATFAPATTTNQNVNYVSNAPNVAKVDAKTGVVTAVGEGKATITATSVAQTAATGGKNLTQTIPVTVTKVVKPTALTIIPDTTSLAKGTSASLAVKATPTAADASVVWSSNNPAAVSVDEATGVVTANQMGSAIITATSTVDAAISDTAIVTVDQAVPGIDVIITGSTTANTLVPAVTGISKLADKDVTTYRFFTWSGEDQSDMQVKEVSAKSAVMNSVTTSFDATGFKAPAATYVDVYAITPNGDIFLGHTVYSELASGVLSAYGVAGNGHVQNIGWQQTDSMLNGGIIGTTGKALRLEAFKLVADPAKYNDVQFVYNVQYSDGTVSGPQTDGHMVGTVGESKSITGVNIQIEGLNAADYTMTYDVHFANDGWKTGSGTDLTTSNGNQIEAIRITSFKAK